MSTPLLHFPMKKGMRDLHAIPFLSNLFFHNKYVHRRFRSRFRIRHRQR